jgi:hypothetical protein
MLWRGSLKPDDMDGGLKFWDSKDGISLPEPIWVLPPKELEVEG